MSYPSSPPLPYQIDIVGEVGRAYQTVLDRAQLVVEMALLPYLIVLGIELFALLIPSAGVFGRLLAVLLHAFGFLIFGSIFIVRWHRFVLLGESVGAGLIPPGWSEFLIVGIKLAAVVFASWVVLVVIALLPPHFVTGPLAAIGGVALALVSLRVSLIFPAAAIERPVGLRTAWDWIAGNFWRLFACALACYLPFVVVQLVLGVIAALFPPLIWIVFEALHLAVSFVGAAIVATLLSHLYREIAGGLA
jgi:hypothetical protein